ncbi:hypothetical protein AQUCO_00100676v1 [Aquilegia coerulea]|uniref:Uncharacterized protein n=1 Tax=Aquilegia coerulea TaxID=218851 RepID=A0A2G5FBG9_AQUCA|nr:hypothetical protein AQUCO_00100676v1 [Aquilegia coerulea]
MNLITHEPVKLHVVYKANNILLVFFFYLVIVVYIDIASILHLDFTVCAIALIPVILDISHIYLITKFKLCLD